MIKNNNNQRWISKNSLTRLYNYDFKLGKKVNRIFEENSNPYTSEKKTNINPVKVQNIKTGTKTKRFASLLLCGGKATRFDNNCKAVYQFKISSVGREDWSFLKANILQVLKIEKDMHFKVPVIISDDFTTRGLIKTYLRNNKYFGKPKNEFYFIKQSTTLRFIPSESLLIKNSLIKQIPKEWLNVLPKKTTLFKSKYKRDTFVPTGHFIFNSLIKSNQFWRLLKRYPETEYLIVSNCNNLGQKYYSTILQDVDNNNYLVVCEKKIEEKMDDVFIINKKIQIRPFFLSSHDQSSFGFTGTGYINIQCLLKIYGYKSIDKFVSSGLRGKKDLNNKYWIVIKTYNLHGNNCLTIHLESPQAEISKYIDITPVLVDRKQSFYPFKSLSDVNEKYIESWITSTKMYKYT